MLRSLLSMPWQAVGRLLNEIKEAFDLPHDLTLLPFSEGRAFFFAASERETVDICSKGVLKYGGVKIMLHRWWPLANTFTTAALISPGLWIHCYGVPFHLWNFSVFKNLGEGRSVEGCRRDVQQHRPLCNEVKGERGRFWYSMEHRR